MNTQQATTPRELPGVILKQKEVYQLWLKLHRDFPRVERLGVGQKIEQSFLTIFELTYISSYLPRDQKVITLAKTITRLDILKFFMQLAFESKLIPLPLYIDISERLLEVGRMLGGWKKGLESKTPII